MGKESKKSRITLGSMILISIKLNVKKSNLHTFQKLSLNVTLQTLMKNF